MDGIQTRGDVECTSECRSSDLDGCCQGGREPREGICVGEALRTEWPGRRLDTAWSSASGRDTEARPALLRDARTSPMAPAPRAGAADYRVEFHDADVSALGD